MYMYIVYIHVHVYVCTCMWLKNIKYVVYIIFMIYVLIKDKKKNSPLLAKSDKNFKKDCKK